MSKITLDADLKAKLNGLNEQFELCDETGATLGRFLPERDFREYYLAWADAQISPEEIEEARREFREGRGMTTKEAIAYLEKIKNKKGSQ